MSTIVSIAPTASTLILCSFVRADDRKASEDFQRVAGLDVAVGYPGVLENASVGGEVAEAVEHHAAQRREFLRRMGGAIVWMFKGMKLVTSLISFC